MAKWKTALKMYYEVCELSKKVKKYNLIFCYILLMRNVSWRINTVLGQLNYCNSIYGI